MTTIVKMPETVVLLSITIELFGISLGTARTVNMRRIFSQVETWIAFVAIGCVILVLTRLAGYASIAATAKIAASMGFLGLAVCCGAFDSSYGRILLAGLALAAVGDVLLIGDSHRVFLFGLASFLLAHVAYIAAFVSSKIAVRWSLSAVVPLALISYAVLSWLTPHVDSEMLLPVRVYTVVITTMVVAAFGTRGAGGATTIVAGATLFYLSDLAVAADRFVQPDFRNFIWGLPFYYAGQVLLALSIRSR